MGSVQDTAPKLSSLPISISVSPAEVKAGSLSWQNLELAIRALHRDGLVVLEDMIDHAKLDYLNEKMVPDAYALQARKDSPFNYNKGNIQQDPPMTKAFFDETIFTNSIVTQVTATAVGPHPRLSFMSGNTALPPTAESPPMAQPTHTDSDFDHPDIPFALVVNVPLVEMVPHNGSTEVWLGTHSFTTLAMQEGAHGDRASGRIKRPLLEKRCAERPPSQPVVKKGSVVVRDLRLWHGGMPNLSDQPRVMLAMIHFAPWYRNTMEVNFAEELMPALTLEKTGLQVQAKYLPEEEVERLYLKGAYGNAYDFDQVQRLDGF